MRARSPRRPVALVAALAALCLVALPAPSVAEEPAAAAADTKAKVEQELKEAREKVRAAAKEAREKVVAAKDEAREKLEAARGQAHEKMKAAHQEMKTKLGAAREELREEMHHKVDQVLGTPGADRARRAREHRRREMHALRPHWKRGSEIPPQAREALRHHARRTARLLRIRALAEAAGDEKSIERCDKLLELERTHHHARMGRFMPKHAAEGAAPAAAPSEPDEGEADDKAAEEEAAEEQP